MSDDPLFAKLDELTDQFRRIDEALMDPAVNADSDRMIELNTRRSAIQPVVEQYQQYQALRREAAELDAMGEAESDAELRDLAASECAEKREAAEALLEQIKADLLTRDDRAVGAVILELRAGVGGEEAGLWAGDLLSMYQGYAERHGWKRQVMTCHGSEMGGCREAIVHLAGEGVWQHLGYEGGTHCVKRVPATETQGRVHTSTATVAVLPEPRRIDAPVDEQDVEISTSTARGPGGQNVNKVATAVRMRHLPTGIEVSMQDTKSQHQNRQLAWQLLRARVAEHHQQQADADRADARNVMIGRAARGERIRTYRWKDNIVVDHRLGASFPLQPTLTGDLDPIVHALIERDKAQRLAAM